MRATDCKPFAMIRYTTTVIFALTLALTVGCSNSKTHQIVGEWVSEDPEELFDGVSDGEPLGQMTLVFKADGTLETISDFPMAQGYKKGTWSHISYEKEQTIANLSCQVMGDEVETKVIFLDDNRIKLVPPNIAVLETEFTFQRKQ